MIPSRIAQAGKLTLHKSYREDQDKLTVKLGGSGLEDLAERGQLLPNTLLVLSPDSRPQRGFRQLRAATRPAATQSRRVACNNTSPHYSTVHNVQLHRTTTTRFVILSLYHFPTCPLRICLMIMTCSLVHNNQHKYQRAAVPNQSVRDYPIVDRSPTNRPPQVMVGGFTFPEYDLR